MRLRSLLVATLLASALACHRAPSQDHHAGQTSFLSAPPGRTGDPGAPGNAHGGTSPAQAGNAGAASPRAVEETDIYRLDGNRLYTLNGYRGLLVFDVGDVDHPRLLGRSPIYGWPIEMVVHHGVATVVVSDWYGQAADGTPFHGSVVRGLDATDPSNIRTLGEAQLPGWVRDTRVVGEVLYAVSEDYGWRYGAAGTSAAPSVVVSSVNLQGGAVQKMGERSYSGWSGVIHVTATAILLAHDATLPGSPSASTQLTYLDISDPAGAIAERGSLLVPGRPQGWGPDNGRFNLDFADGKTAHLFGCGGPWCGGDNGGAPWLLTTVSFANPGAPVQVSSLQLDLGAWSPAVRFDAQRMYLAPGSTWTGASSTPLQIYDLADPAHPRLAGQTQVPGAVWSFFPQGMSVMALGSDAGPGQGGQRVSVNAIDATDAAHPRLAGTVAFGDGWAWTPAAGTFKAFTRDDALGLIVLPFAGWSAKSQGYRNGLQLIELSSGAIQPAGAAIVHGWVERGIFVNGRLLALSDLSLSVVDASDHQHPSVVFDLTLARNITSALPMGDRIAELSSDFWDNDLSTSTVRVLPIAAADELAAGAALSELTVDGVNARVFRNGFLAYLVSDVRLEVPCASAPSGWGSRVEPDGKCRQWSQEIQVVDLSGGSARARGKALLPGSFGWGPPGPGFAGCFPWDWFNGADAVQVQGDALAFRRWVVPEGLVPGDRAQQGLFIVDLANPDAPAIARLTLTDDDSAWWGNLTLVGDALYATHEEWVDRASRQPTVRYFANRIDLSDRAHPRVASRVNVPGVVIGGPAADPSLLYVTGYRWGGEQAIDSFDVVRLHGDTAELIGGVDLDGWVGRTFVRGTSAYVSVQQWNPDSGAAATLHQLDLGDPAHPSDRPAPAHAGWGWLVGLEGDRAVVTSGWSGAGLDVYRLAPGKAPALDRFVRTRGYWPSALARQGDDLFVSSGYWGVETIHLGAK